MEHDGLMPPSGEIRKRAAETPATDDDIRKKIMLNPGILVPKKCSISIEPLTSNELAQRSTVTSKPSTDAPTPTRRSGSHMYFNCAEGLQVLDSSHVPDDEGYQYRQFVAGIESTCQPKQHNGILYYETQHGIWLPTIVRYNDNKAKLRTVAANSDKDFWLKDNRACCTVLKMMSQLLKICQKPICVLLAQRPWPLLDRKKQLDHCYILTVIPTSEGRRGIVKDSLAIEETYLRGLAHSLLNSLDIKYAELVGKLDTEESETDTDCFRESYKIVGDILDGNFFWERNVIPFKKTYNVKRRKPEVTTC